MYALPLFFFLLYFIFLLENVLSFIWFILPSSLEFTAGRAADAKGVCPHLKRYSLQERKGWVAPDLICKAHSTPCSLLGPRSLDGSSQGSTSTSFSESRPCLSPPFEIRHWNDEVIYYSQSSPLILLWRKWKGGAKSEKKRGFWWKRELLKSPPLSLCQHDIRSSPR